MCLALLNLKSYVMTQKDQPTGTCQRVAIPDTGLKGTSKNLVFRDLIMFLRRPFPREPVSDTAWSVPPRLLTGAPWLPGRSVG